MVTSSRRLYFAVLGSLLVAYLLPFWLLQILPCQDLPQHLAYTRVFADFSRTDLRFSEFYRLPEHFEPYFSVYIAMAWLSRWISLSVAMRLLMTAYVVGMFASFHVLVASVRRTPTSSLRDPQWSTPLVALAVFSPSVAMGFLSYFLCIPLLLLGVAGAVGAVNEHSRRYDFAFLLTAALLLPSIHTVAAGAFLLFLLFFAIAAYRRAWDNPTFLTVPLSVVLFVTWAWNRWGNLGLGHAPSFNWREAMAKTLAFDVVNPLFRLTWSDPPIVLSQISWTVLGPFRWDSQLMLAIILIAFIRFLRLNGRPLSLSPPPAYRSAAVAFAIFCCLLPWGLYVPTEVTFINLRMETIGYVLLLAAIDPSWFEKARSRALLVAVSLVVIANFSLRSYQFNREARTALDLIDRVEDNKILMSLPFHNRTDYFAKQIRLTHFLPMYYMVQRGGIASQFWAKYTDHLPIDYRPGKRPIQTPDWNPEQFKDEHLATADYLLAQWASPQDAHETRTASDRVQGMLNANSTVTKIDCEGLWCLYRLR